MAQCKRCNSRIPRTIVVEGKRRNLQRRKYCFECSPFGEHNTQQLERIIEAKGNGIIIKICPSCKREHMQSGKKCFSCYFNTRKNKVSAAVADIVGNSCWICGYDKTKNSLCFHHLDPKNKKHQLSTRELMLKWSRVLGEMKKCIFICMNCHGEIHAGLVDPRKIEKIWMEFWAGSSVG